MVPFTPLPFKIDQVYLTSDTHYGHKNICKGTTSWEEDHAANCRPFQSISEMDDAIVNGINSLVQKDDLLIHCGDWSFGGKENVVNFRERIICDHVILIQGNHDHQISSLEHVDFKHTFLNFHQIGFFRVESLKFVCAHYPMAIWHQSHHNVPLFYGHVHGSYENVGKSLDVGIDNIYKLKGTYTPIALQEAYSICQSKNAFLESHHDEFTN